MSNLQWNSNTNQTEPQYDPDDDYFDPDTTLTRNPEIARKFLDFLANGDDDAMYPHCEWPGEPCIRRIKGPSMLLFGKPLCGIHKRVALSRWSRFNAAESGTSHNESLIQISKEETRKLLKIRQLSDYHKQEKLARTQLAKMRRLDQDIAQLSRRHATISVPRPNIQIADDSVSAIPVPVNIAPVIPVPVNTAPTIPRDLLTGGNLMDMSP
jgi:hypothetical protein